MENIDDKAFRELENSVNTGIVKMSVSSPHKKSNTFTKIVIEQVEVKNSVGLQFSLYFENMVTHENYIDKQEAIQRLWALFQMGYKQWDVTDEQGAYKLIVNKKGNFKRIEGEASTVVKTVTGHNKEKNYVLKEGEPIGMLISLGLMNKEGKILADKQKKFRQINKFLEIVESIEKSIPMGANIIDFGCGKSYLTFALYYYLNEILDKNVKIIGLDLKADVVDYCNKLAEDCGFTNLQFYCQNINTYENKAKISLMVTLHACDIATDFALSFAVKNNVGVILSVPCCQHELFYQVDNPKLTPLLKHGILKERFSALLTDSARGAILESMGYKVGIMEFVDMEHTPKNIMIKAVETNRADKEVCIKNYQEMAAEFSIKPKLESLLEEELYGSK